MTSQLLLVRTILCAVRQVSQGQLCVHQTCDNARFVLRLVRTVLCTAGQFSQGHLCVHKACDKDSCQTRGILEKLVYKIFYICSRTYRQNHCNLENGLQNVQNRGGHLPTCMVHLNFIRPIFFFEWEGTNYGMKTSSFTKPRDASLTICH